MVPFSMASSVSGCSSGSIILALTLFTFRLPVYVSVTVEPSSTSVTPGSTVVSPALISHLLASSVPSFSVTVPCAHAPLAAISSIAIIVNSFCLIYALVI